MNATLTAPAAEEPLVREALSAVRLPRGVRLLRFFFDTDHTGDPALRIVYGVSKKFPLTKARVRDLSALSQATRMAVSETGIDPFPYTTFEDIR